MKIFIWQDIGELTGNYHSGGALAVCAKSVTEARKLAENKGVKFSEEEMKPDRSYAVSKTHKAEVFIFRDAGCC